MSSTISLLFSGDFAPCRRYESIVLSKRAKIFGDLQNNIVDADISFLNLELPLTLKGKPIKKTGSNFNAHPDCIKAVKDAGFDIVGLANNHIMDFGSEGLEQTILACKGSGLNICGAGKNLKEAQQTTIIESCGLKVAYIAVTEHEFSIASEDRAGAAPLDLVDNTLKIESVRNKVDLIFVSIHGGNEYFPFPRPNLKKLSRFLISRGARYDVLIEGIDIFEDFLVISERYNGLNRIKIKSWDNSINYYIDFNSETFCCYTTRN